MATHEQILKLLGEYHTEKEFREWERLSRDFQDKVLQKNDKSLSPHRLYSGMKLLFATVGLERKEDLVGKKVLFLGDSSGLLTRIARDIGMQAKGIYLEGSNIEWSKSLSITSAAEYKTAYAVDYFQTPDPAFDPKDGYDLVITGDKFDSDRFLPELLFDGMPNKLAPNARVILSSNLLPSNDFKISGFNITRPESPIPNTQLLVAERIPTTL